jgi:hypothetical protein
MYSYYSVRRDWRYQRDNQNPYIEDDQTTQLIAYITTIEIINSKHVLTVSSVPLGESILSYGPLSPRGLLWTDICLGSMHGLGLCFCTVMTWKEKTYSAAKSFFHIRILQDIMGNVSYWNVYINVVSAPNSRFSWL